MAEEPYLVLARKWRPQTFADVVGQEHITRTIQNAIAAGRIGHAFLFIGSRGIGKTTTARIVAKALNCESADGPTPDPCNACENCKTIGAGTSIDVIEIDGASNNSVEDVRQIRENIRLVPTRSRYKIYVIDEVHQLSQAAFNALLKTLEEPPEHAVFVLATTEAHKVPATIISRCQRYDFRRVGQDDIVALLRRIVETENIQADDEALYAIARAAEGGIRDSESILEQVISYCDKEITFRDVFDVLGLVDWQALSDLCRAIVDKDVAAQLRIIEDIVTAGKDLSQFVQDILGYFRNLLVCKTTDPAGLIALPEDELATLQDLATRFTVTQLVRLVEQFAELSKDFDSQLAQRIALEALLIRISEVAVDVSVDTVLEKLAQLGAGGVQVSGSAAPGPAAVEKKKPEPLTAPAEALEQAPIPAEESPPDPDPARAQVVSGNLRREWIRIARYVGEKHMSLGAALSHLRDVDLDGETLVLNIGDENGHSRSVVESGLGEIEAAVRALTSNLTGVRFETREPETATFQVATTQVDAALKDPHVSKVVDVFKGRIVDIRPDVKPKRPS